MATGWRKQHCRHADPACAACLKKREAIRRWTDNYRAGLPTKKVASVAGAILGADGCPYYPNGAW